MTTEAWAAMERLATAMTNARARKEKERKDKLEEIRRYNSEHPIQPVVSQNDTIVYQSDEVKPITNHWWQVGKQFQPKKK